MPLTAFDPGAAREARRVLEYNPYHGPDGKFATKGAAKTTVAYSGRAPQGGKKAAVARELQKRRSGWYAFGSPRLYQDERARLARRKSDPAFAAGQDAEHSYREARRYPLSRAHARGWGKRHTDRRLGRDKVDQNPAKYTRRGGDGHSQRASSHLAAGRAWSRDRLNSGDPAALSVRQEERWRDPATGPRARAHDKAARDIRKKREALQADPTRRGVRQKLDKYTERGNPERKMGPHKFSTWYGKKVGQAREDLIKTETNRRSLSAGNTPRLRQDTNQTDFENGPRANHRMAADYFRNARNATKRGDQKSRADWLGGAHEQAARARAKRGERG